MRKVGIALGIMIFLAGLFLVFHPNTTVSGTKIVSHYIYLPGEVDWPQPEVYYGSEISTLEDTRHIRAILYVDSPCPELKPEPEEVLCIHEVEEGASVRVSVHGTLENERETCWIRLTDSNGDLLVDKTVGPGYEFIFEAEKGCYELEMLPTGQGDWFYYGCSWGISLSDSYSYPVKVNPPQPVILWQLPYGPLGILCLALGGFLTFRSFPPRIRFKVLGPFLALCAIGFAFGFSFNWFYDWFDSTGAWTYGKESPVPWVPFVAFCCAVTGGFFIGHSFVFNKKWLAALLALISCLSLFILAFLTFPGDYYSYSDPTSEPYPYYHDFSGDYLIEALAILFLQFCIFSGLFGGFLVGLVRKKKPL